MRPSNCQGLCCPAETKKNISRLESLECVVFTRIYNTCQEVRALLNFKEYDKIFWIEPRTVLTWIRTPPRESILLVSVQIAEVRQTVGSEHFRSIKSKYNPADALTGPGKSHLVTLKAGGQDHRFSNCQKPNGLIFKTMTIIPTRNDTKR